MQCSARAKLLQTLKRDTREEADLGPESIDQLVGAAPEHLIVTKINDGGLLERWNLALPDAAVQINDRIVTVNRTGTVENMRRCMQDAVVRLSLVRFPPVFEVELQKRPGVEKLGFKFERPSNLRLSELRVTEVLAEGLLSEWNRRQAAAGRFHLVVTREMRLEAANDVEGDAAGLAEELRSCSAVRLRIRRIDVLDEVKRKVFTNVKLLKAFGAHPARPQTSEGSQPNLGF